MKKLLIVTSLLALTACETVVIYENPGVPIEVCDWVKKPIYTTITHPPTSGQIATGALVGGLVGNYISNGDDGATVTGAIVGGLLANGPTHQRVVTGYRTIWECKTVYR